MKYTIEGFDQETMIEYGMDCIDAVLLRWFIDFKDAGKMVVLEYESNKYYWIKYQGLIEDLPILGISNKNNIYRRLKNLKPLEHKTFRNKKGTFAGYKINEKLYIKLIDKIHGKRNKNSPPLSTQKSNPIYSKVEPPIYSKVEAEYPSTKVYPSIKKLHEEIDNLYNSYPTTDPNNNNRSIAKGSKSKTKIEQLIRSGTYTIESLRAVQAGYLAGCARTKTYLKNYMSFLRDIPELVEPAKPKDDHTKEKAEEKANFLRALKRGRIPEKEILDAIKDGYITQAEVDNAKLL